MIFFMILIISSCVVKYANTADRHQILQICNNLDKDVYFDYGGSGGSILRCNFVANPSLLVKAKKCTKDYDFSGFEAFFEAYPEQKLYVNFFDPEVIATIPFDTIQKYDMILGRKGYTKEQLDSLDWTVSIP